MTLTITIECDNDAFQPRPAREVGRLLKQLRATFHMWPAADWDGLKLLDENGNTVGRVTVTP